MFIYLLVFVLLLSTIVLLVYGPVHDRVNKHNIIRDQFISKHNNECVVFMTHKFDNFVKTRIEKTIENIPSTLDFIIFIPNKNDIRNINILHDFCKTRRCQWVLGANIPEWAKFDYDTHSESWFYFNNGIYDFYYFCEYDVASECIDWNLLLKDVETKHDVDFITPKIIKPWRGYKQEWHWNHPCTTSVFTLPDDETEAYRQNKCGSMNFFVRVSQEMINMTHLNYKEIFKYDNCKSETLQFEISFCSWVKANKDLKISEFSSAVVGNVSFGPGDIKYSDIQIGKINHPSKSFD
jgi:hypothetical protein